MTSRLSLMSLAFAFGIALAAASAGPVRAQTAPLESGVALSDEERMAFDARLRAAGSDQVRARIAKERDDLVRSRLAQRGPTQAIPPGPHEANGDLVMSDVPTPEFDQKAQMTTQPAGAFAPMSFGSNPFGRPVSDPFP